MGKRMEYDEESDEQDVYVCKICGFVYKQKKYAEQCEAWCRSHKSCSLVITKHAVQRQKTS